MTPRKPSAGKRELDPYTLRHVARYHGRLAVAAEADNRPCGAVMNTFAARHWQQKAEAIESRAKRKGRK